MKKTKILFICIHNSARSQMAEAFLNHLAGDRFEAKSAGIEPGRLNPFAIEAMAESGIDISQNKTKSIPQALKDLGPFDLVITVCDETSAERCPAVPGVPRKLHWDFEDPSNVPGGDAEKRRVTRKVRDQIRTKISEWIKTA